MTDDAIAHIRTDADQALALFQSMSTSELRRAHRAYLVDAESDRAVTIVFAGGRAKLIAHVLRQRGVGIVDIDI